MPSMTILDSVISLTLNSIFLTNYEYALCKCLLYYFIYCYLGQNSDYCFIVSLHTVSKNLLRGLQFVFMYSLGDFFLSLSFSPHSCNYDILSPHIYWIKYTYMHFLAPNTYLFLF